MGIDLAYVLAGNNLNGIYKSAANNNITLSPSVSNPLSPLKEDCFVKSPTEEGVQKEEIEIGDCKYYEKSSVSAIQRKISDKKQDLQFYEKQLKRYPNNLEYGRKVDKLRKEIKDLERELARAL